MMPWEAGGRAAGHAGGQLLLLQPGGGGVTHCVASQFTLDGGRGSVGVGEGRVVQHVLSTEGVGR